MLNRLWRPHTLLALAVLAVLVAGTGTLIQTAHAAPTLLPNEPTWNGVPSFDFGSNDGVNWDTQYNMDVAPDAQPIQAALKSGGMPIIRAWFFQKSLVDGHALTDAEQLQKLHAVQGAGAICFANFPTENTIAYDLHLLSVLGGACPYVEVMNEPDIEGVNSTAYLSFWNSFIPQARAQFPGILFGGPADYDNQGNECSYYPDGTSACFLQKVMMGMKASGNLPDFVTYHWYPCWEMSASACLAQAGSYASAAQQVIDWDVSIFGHEIPVLCSEWNADPGNPSYMNDRSWDAQYITAALKNIETSGLAGAMYYDISEYGNYGADDEFDIYSGGAPFATWTAHAAEIARVKGSGAPPPPPTPTGTVPPNPTPTPTPPPPTPAPPPGGCTQKVAYNGLTVSPNAVAPGSSVAMDVNLTTVCADQYDFVEFNLIDSTGDQLMSWDVDVNYTAVAQDVTYTWAVPASYAKGKYTVKATALDDNGNQLAGASPIAVALSIGSEGTLSATTLRNVPCAVTLSGVSKSGKCSGTFYH